MRVIPFYISVLLFYNANFSKEDNLSEINLHDYLTYTNQDIYIYGVSGSGILKKDSVIVLGTVTIDNIEYYEFQSIHNYYERVDSSGKQILNCYYVVDSLRCETQIDLSAPVFKDWDELILDSNYADTANNFRHWRKVTIDTLFGSEVQVISYVRGYINSPETFEFKYAFGIGKVYYSSHLNWSPGIYWIKELRTIKRGDQLISPIFLKTEKHSIHKDKVEISEIYDILGRRINWNELKRNHIGIAIHGLNNNR